MPLIVRTPQMNTPLRKQPLTKGQLYNLDKQQFINFQFNPQAFEWSQTWSWAEVRWKGARRGGDLQYQSEGARELELDLLFIADPGAPRFLSNTGDRLSTPDLAMNYTLLVTLFDEWQARVPGKGRPSRIMLIFGELFFVCVITQIHHRITEMFNDLTAREATISIAMREWILEPDSELSRVFARQRAYTSFPPLI